MPKVTVLGYQVSHSLNGRRYVDTKREMCVKVSPERLEKYRKHLIQYFMKKFPHQGKVDIFFVTIEAMDTKVTYTQIIEDKLAVSLSEN